MMLEGYIAKVENDNYVAEQAFPGYDDGATTPLMTVSNANLPRYHSISRPVRPKSAEIPTVFLRSDGTSASSAFHLRRIVFVRLPLSFVMVLAVLRRRGHGVVPSAEHCVFAVSPNQPLDMAITLAFGSQDGTGRNIALKPVLS